MKLLIALYLQKAHYIPAPFVNKICNKIVVINRSFSYLVWVRPERDPRTREAGEERGQDGGHLVMGAHPHRTLLHRHEHLQQPSPQSIQSEDR